MLRLFFLALALLAATSSASVLDRSGCDACRFQIDSIDEPVSLAGTWLFTRDDHPDNGRVDIDTRDWRLVRAPGTWKGVYEDRKNFSTGWYRGTLHFDRKLIGEEVVVLVDAYMGRVAFHLDGNEIYRRPGNINIERYYSIQPIPIRFRVTSTQHVVSMRVESPLMKGIYQLPFELRRYDPHDVSLAHFQFVGGEMRVIAAYVVLFFGLFFLVVHYKTRYPLYLMAGLASVITFPFFAAPNDYFLRIFSPEKMLYIHYMGVYCTFLHYMFCQYFLNQFTIRLNWIGGIIGGVLAGIMVSMAVVPNLDLFQPVRSAFIVTMASFMIGAVYMSFQATRKGQPGGRILLFGSLIFLATTIHDTLLALGLIDSVALLFIGALTFTAAMLLVASSTFANTFLENKQLVKTLTTMNDRLEDLVAERTEKLGMALEELNSANQNLRTSYEQLSMAKDELVRSEKLAALGSLVAGIAHELNTPIGNGLMAITTLRDELTAFRKDMAEKGLRRSVFESFLGTVETAASITGRSLDRSAELVSSFKQIAVDQTTSNRRKFKLQELIGETLNVLHPTLKKTPYKVEVTIPEALGGIQLDSFPGPLVQVLTNLINNAVIHAFDGRDHGTITIEVRDDAKGGAGVTESLLLIVRDDGRGIAEKDLSKIFDPFFTTRLGEGGSGLGLHISHNIVMQTLGGNLKVSSQLGVGTEFILVLPVNAPVLTKRDDETAEAASSPTGSG